MSFQSLGRFETYKLLFLGSASSLSRALWDCWIGVSNQTEIDQSNATYSREFSLVAKVEECTNTILSVKVAVVLDESESTFNVSGI